MKLKTALTIAGSDSGGGAGIQADLKTMNSIGVWGMSVITCVTAQNLSGVIGIQPVNLDIIEKQIDAVFSGFPVHSVKTGMLFSEEIIDLICQKVKEYKIKKLVIDPVMVATSGAKLLKAEASEVLINKLLPNALLVTPNKFEAEMISNSQINNYEEMKNSAKIIYDKNGTNILIKGGHILQDIALDLLFDGTNFIEFKSKRFDAKFTHGTGCTFSSAISSYLALEYDLLNSINLAKKYISNAIKNCVSFNNESGGLNFRLSENKSIEK